MAKRWAACFCILMLALCIICSALGETYPARNIFFDEESISYVAASGGKLYALLGSSLVRMEPDGSLVSLGQIASEGWISALAAHGETLYALDQAEDGWRTLCLPVTGNGLDTASVLPLALPEGAWISQVRADAGTLWLLCSAGAEQQLFAWPLDGGAEQSWTVKNVQDFDLQGDGRVMLLRQEQSMTGRTYSLYAFDPATGQETTWATWEEASGNRLAYDAAKRIAYLFGRESVYTVQEQGTPAYLDGFLAGGVVSVALLENGAALVVDNMLTVRDFTQESAQRLRVMCDHGRGEEYRAFVEANPQIDLQFVSPTLDSCEEQFTQDMLLKNGHADVYILEDLSVLTSIKEKGYFVDMGQNADLAALAEQMYPAFQSLFCEGEAVAAFPKDVFLEVLCYHKPTFEALGMEPPATYQEYFDFCLAWMEELGEAYPDVALRPFANGLDLETLLTRYANEQMRQGTEPTFAVPEMVALMEQYFAVVDADARAEDINGTALFASYTLPLWGAEDAYGYLPLSFGGEATLSPAEGDVSYFVINPYGENALAAMEFVDAYNEKRAEVGQALLFSSINQPLERVLFASEYAAMEKRLAELEASLAEAEPAAQRDIEVQISEQKTRMHTLATEERWAVTQEALATYQDLSGLIWLNPSNAMPRLWDDLPQLEADASPQRITAFLETLDQRWQMLRLEDGVSQQ